MIRSSRTVSCLSAGIARETDFLEGHSEDISVRWKLILSKDYRIWNELAP